MSDLTMTGTQIGYKLAAILLQYPSRALFDGLSELRAAATAVSPNKSRDRLMAFMNWLDATGLESVTEQYVRTFDLRRRCALYLTYYRFGDTRRRGMALLEFKTAYRVAGFDPTEDELPDYLPMVLEFASLSQRGEHLLHRHRADLELLRRALDDAGSPYLPVVTAVCAQQAALGRRELQQVRTAWESGPPAEEVGLEPFAPPEYLAGYPAGQTTPINH